MSQEICEVVVTADSEDWLVALTRSLVEDGLAACGQHVAPIRSVYRWAGEIHDEPEARVALHTRRSLVPTLIDRVRREHPNEVPCVLVLPVVAADASYAEWVLGQTAGTA